MTLNDLERLSKIIIDTNHAASLRQLSCLSMQRKKRFKYKFEAFWRKKNDKIGRNITLIITGAII